jgi:hypothetical protein
MYLTVISTNKIKGFVPEKNSGRACVKIWAFLLKSANDDAWSRQMGVSGE